MIRIIVMVFMLVGGTATSQLPEFSQQYRQRLGGTIDALDQILADFRRDAAAYGLSVPEAIARQKASDDPFIRARGDSMQTADMRLSRLRQQQERLETAGPLERLVVFAHGFDRQLAQATAEDYEPAVPVTFAGLFSAGIGALAGYLVVSFFIGLIRLGRRRKPARG
ncbi:hypothetical protein IWQ51_000052 [Labrenzia sp. EL_142]|nr:hypothetical protein [Labrenzia sp. EL_142]